MAYPGGKAQAGVYQAIIHQIPTHTFYGEPFLGKGAVLRYKRPATRSIGIDANPDVVQHWQEHSMPGVIVRCGDALEFLNSFRFGRDAFLYLDPPYLMEVRSTQQAYYQHEFFEDEQHLKLLRLIKTLRCNIAISGYWSQMYAQMLSDWRVISFNAVTRSGRVATEHLWMNYPEPVELHDYRYLGSNFRERERIKRKTQRWLQKLKAMPLLERRALMAAINQLSADIATSDDDGDGRGPVLSFPSPDLAMMANIDENDDSAGGIATNGDAGALERSQPEIDQFLKECEL
ncbi:MAG: DNA adenine methylase [Chloroflexi bacterium AL-W]|nr:DNA adenine methylase [Chloroflexi bacterium AL-N1]NOK70159.1 DNA adenine methylase [Chloroflexi bacterium AL-N10]NOK77696.1 DNA adenine methylase [Chloroflexi bacterium AL-N5]NOK84705.1 DNA adenine methylase [Chloroflexi bacterium AL-W]NOK93232.1 DNA adenine methylase [Chloroflexi bacterium AL-N15]